MIMDIDELGAQLAELTQGPAPASTIDVAAALTAGRGRMRRRRVFFATGAGVLALVVGLGATLLPARGPEQVSPAGTAQSTPGSGPLTVPLAFGWLPESMDHVDYSWAAGSTVGGVSASGSYTTATFDLTYFPVGTKPGPDYYNLNGKDVAYVRTAAQPINGSTGYWLAMPGPVPTLTELRWQVSGGGWVQLRAIGGAGADLQTTMRRIAADVRLGSYAVPFPLRVQGLPKSFALQSVNLSRSTGASGNRAWEGDMLYSLGRNAPRLLIDVGLVGSTNPPVAVASSAADDRVCSTSGPVRLCAYLSSGSARSLTAIGGLNGVLEHVTLLGPDQRNWTTHVFG